MYSKELTPQRIEEIPRYLEEELSKVETELQSPSVESVSYTINYSLPDKPRAGQVYYADGSTWNPGSGEGLYRFNLSSAWVFVG